MTKNLKLKTIRLKMGLTQKMFAKKVGVSQTAVSQWENKVTLPSVVTCAKISKLAAKYKIYCAPENLGRYDD